jgi:hypothetical protein
LGFTIQGLGFRIQGLGFRNQGLGFRNQGLGFTIQGLGFTIQGLGFRIQGLGFRIQGLGFRIQGLGFRFKVWGFLNSGFRVNNIKVKIQAEHVYTFHSSLPPCWQCPLKRQNPSPCLIPKGYTLAAKPYTLHPKP